MPGLFQQMPGGLGVQQQPSGGLGLLDRAASFRDQNPGVLSMIGAGLMNRNLAQGFAGAGQLMQVNKQRNQTARFLLNRGLAKDEEEALALAAQPQLINALMKDPKGLINVGNGYLYNQDTGQWIKSPGAGQERVDVPTSIQEFERAQADPEFKKWMTTGKGRDSSLMAGDRQAVRESEDMAMAANNTVDMLKSAITAPAGGKALNDRAGSGEWAGTQAWLARNDPTGFFDDATGEATTELNNVVMGQALASLKAIFGAAPTEGERQILIDMQASVDKTPAERKIIMERAIQLAEKRKAFYMDRANELRGGTYYQPGGGMDATIPAPAGGEDPLGIR